MSLSVSHREYATDSARWNQLLSSEDLPFCPVESFLPHESALRVYALSGRSWLSRFRQAVNFCAGRTLCVDSLFGFSVVPSKGFFGEHSLQVSVPSKAFLVNTLFGYHCTTEGILSEHPSGVLLLSSLALSSGTYSKTVFVTTEEID